MKSNLAAQLLEWYDHNRRHLPWRAEPGHTPDPYRVWLSEVMLQQTTVATVIPYFQTFVTRWPTVQDLAHAPIEDILAQWAGLGYYARARNLHKCAQAVAAKGGHFPENLDGLKALPGIGDYTAAAILSIAFDIKATVMDGNIERVVSRLFAVTEPLPRAKGTIKSFAGEITPELRPGDYAQGVMDLGATVCSPTKPACALCPWMEMCEARQLGIAEQLPRKEKKAPKPTRYAMAFVVHRSDGSLLLQKRPDKGLLGGMWEVPSTPWELEPWDFVGALPHAPMRANWRLAEGEVKHTFTHFHLKVRVLSATADAEDGDNRYWVARDQLDRYGIPTVIKKMIDLEMPE